MSKSKKAALISALVFPGAGHLYLKKYLSGALFVVVTLGSLSYLIVKTVEIALQITEDIQAGKVQLTVMEITELVSKQTSGSEAQLYDIATAVIFIFWLAGIVDSYRIGRVQDKKSGLQVGSSVQ